MRVVFAGTPHVAVPTLTAIVAAGHEVAAVLTQPDAPGKRGRALISSHVSDAAIAGPWNAFTEISSATPNRTSRRELSN